MLSRAVSAFLLSLVVATVTRAQLSQAGTYFGKIGANDVVVYVLRNDSVNVFALDYGTRTMDLVFTGLDSSFSAVGTSPRGRAYNLQVRDGVARGTFGGFSFVAPKEPIVGSYSTKTGFYSGVMQDERLNTGMANVRLYATGRVLLLYSSPSGDLAGLGQVTPTGQVTAPMTDGNFYSFVFKPDPLLIVASSGAISVNGREALKFIFFGNSFSKMVNISTRGAVAAGSPMTAGFVVTNSAKTVLIRGIGPTLTQFGVANACPDTQLTLYSGQSVIATNGDWYLNSTAKSAEIVESSAQVGAFSLLSSSRDAVILVTVEPGAYTVQLAAQGTVGGEALVEVYQVN